MPQKLFSPFIRSICLGMGQNSCNWRSYWDLATPDQACGVLLERYGPRRAKRAAVESVRAARLDDRDADRWFWLAVLCRLHGVDLDAYFGSRQPVQGHLRRLPRAAGSDG